MAQCMPMYTTSVFTAQAVFLLERGQISRQTKLETQLIAVLTPRLPLMTLTCPPAAVHCAVPTPAYDWRHLASTDDIYAAPGGIKLLFRSI